VTPALVDSDVLLDVATDDPSWNNSSATLAEVSIGFEFIEAVEEALPSDIYCRDDLSLRPPSSPGRDFVGTASLEAYGARRCPISTSARSAVAGYRLLTRDATHCRSYFPRWSLLLHRAGRRGTRPLDVPGARIRRTRSCTMAPVAAVRTARTILAMLVASATSVNDDLRGRLNLARRKERPSPLPTNFAQELLFMLAEAGFGDVAIEASYQSGPATPADGFVVFVARRLDQSTASDARGD
jgi:hypothetical protein